MNEKKVALFEEKEIRKILKDGKWHFSIIDVVLALTDSVNPRRYWSDLKVKLLKEGYDIQLYEIIVQLKLESSDGKKYMTDCADTEGILRIIQSIPSPKAEPFKRWLAKVGSERIEEINDPELAMTRMRELYKKKGYSKSWIEQRERSIVTRNNLTNEWNERGAITPKDYAILTNEIYTSGFGLTASKYKNIKGIHESRNLRDSMTNIELALTNLGEASSVEIHKKNDSIGMDELSKDTRVAGGVLKVARTELEKELEYSVVSNQNYLDLTHKGKIIEKK